MERFGIQMYTLRDYMRTPEDCEETLRRLEEMGYNSVQIRPPEFWSAQELEARLEAHHLTADSGYLSVYDIPAQIAEAAEQKRCFGTDVLRTDSISNEQRRSAEGFSAFAAHLNTCGRLLREEGLQLMYHFHAFEYIKLGDKTGMDILLEETDPKLVFFQPDVFWLTSAGKEPSRELSRFAGRARYIHLKDYFIAPGRDAVLEHTEAVSGPVGVGNLHWKEILSVCRRIGIENYVAEDDIGGVYDPFESAAISCKNLREMLK